MLDIQTAVIIAVQLIVGVAIVATMKNDISHLKRADEKQEKRLAHMEKIQVSHETRLTLAEEKIR